MNILVITKVKSYNHSKRPEIEIFIKLSKLNHNISILTVNNSEYKNYFLKNNIKIYETDLEKKIEIKAIKKIREIIKKNNVDIVYATTSRAISNAIFGCLFLKPKLVVYRGTSGGLYRFDPSSYLNALNPRVNGIICVSEDVKKKVSKQLWFKNTKNISTIYKGHDLNWYNVFASDLTEFETNTNNFNVVFVGNIRPHKGLKYFIKAAMELSDIENIHFLIICYNYTKEYSNLIEKTGIKHRIHVAQNRKDVINILKSCNILVHPSTSKEGLPRVILEALASGTPVIATDNNNSLEIIENKVNGYIVPKKDSTSIAKKIRKLYNEPETLKKLRENTKNIFKDKMSHDITVENHIRFFEKIIKNID